MQAWEKLKNRIKVTEVMVLSVALFVLLFGCLCDFLVSRDIVFLVVKDISSVSLTLLQIQAAVTTLTLTIMALLSGNISESYMGVSVSRFYLELRPYVLRQKTLILIEFVFLAVSVFGHLFGRYNLVIAIFMTSLLYILISIMEVISVFKGKRNSIAEIEEFVSWNIEKGKYYREIIDGFRADWKEIIVDQPNEEYEDYFLLFMKMVYRTLNEEQDVQNVNVYSEDIAMFLLSHDEKKAHSRGIVFVNEYYRQLWLWINDNQEKAQQLKGEIQLISRIVHELYMAIDTLEAEEVEPILEWEHLSESVIRVASWIDFTNNNSGEVNAINSLARTLGTYVTKQYKKGNIVNSKRWESLIGDRFGFGAYGIPEEAIGYYRKSMAMRDFCVCYGYLLNGQVLLVKNALFLESLSNLYNVEYEEYVLKVMLIHCFMYYLGFRESLECIDEELQREIKGTLLDTKVINSINHFYYRIVEGKNALNAVLETQMEEILDRFELFPKHSNGKTMIINGIVRDYFLLASLIVERYSFRREAFASLLDVDKYYPYLLDSNYQVLRQRLFELYGIFESDKKSEEEKYKKLDDMIAVFDTVIKEKYKLDIIKKAAESQRKYETFGIQESTEEKIKQVIIDKFNSMFRGMDRSCKGMKKYKKIHVFRCIDFTRWLGEDIRNAYSDYPFGNFTNWLINQIKTAYGIDVLVRDESFDDDESFRVYLSERNYNTLLGSQYVFGCEDYESYREHADFLSERNCMFMPTSHVGVAACDDAICIRLDDVKVDIFSPNFDEMDVKKDEDSGLISYSPTSGISINFEEKELREFIHDERKVVDIYFSITLGIKKKTNKEVCSIIVRKQ